MKFVNEYLDELQTVETTIVDFFYEYPELNNYAVERAYEALIKLYSADLNKRDAKLPQLDELDKALFDRLKEVCDIMIGDKADIDRKVYLDENIEIRHVSKEEMIKCLKKLHKSVKTWTKRLGRQGYLNFLTSFLK